MSMDKRTKIYEELIPELRDWNDGRGIDVETWISRIGNIEEAIGFSRLFWPEFVLHDDCVLRDGLRQEDYRSFLAQNNSDRQAVERVMNHVHIVDLFECREEGRDPTAEQLVFWGRVLREIWQTKLDRDFPKLNIQVSFLEVGVEELMDYELTVYQAAA
jgi:hypothetical protein